MVCSVSFWFDLNDVGVYEADFVIKGRPVPVRLFADRHSEKVLKTSEVRERIVGELGCDPGGWALHSSLGERSHCDAEAFTAAHPETAKAWEPGRSDE